MEYRSFVEGSDVEGVEAVTRATGFFSEAEVGIARELVEERLSKGESASGYSFLLQDAPNSSALDAYACYGPVPGTKSSFDLYWIVVAPQAQGRGCGRRLLAAVEQRVREAGGRRLYADTSSRPQYAATRAFYERTGFTQVAYLEDFYDEGDGKVIYAKRV